MPNNQKTTTHQVAVHSPIPGMKWVNAYVGVMLLYGLLIFILSLVGYFNLTNFKNSDDHQESEEIEINWRRNYIKDIKIEATGGQCPLGYEPWHSRYWPGITQGCSCINTDGEFDKVVSQGSCSQLQLNSKCVSVPQQNSQALYKWKDDVTICLQRGTTSFVTSPANCGTGFKRCGTGSVRFCLPDGEVCPITDAFFSTKLWHTGYTRLDLGNNRYFFYARDNDKFPISSFELTEYAQCIFNSQNNISPGRSDYVLLKAQRQNCYANESRLSIMDTLGEKDVYTNNGLYTQLKGIPGYPRPDNDFKWSMGFLRYFDWSDSCRNGAYSIDETIEKISMDTPIKVSLAVCLAGVIVAIITGVLIPLKHLKSRRIFNQKQRKYQRLDVEEAKQRNVSAPKFKLNYRKMFSDTTYLLDKALKLVLFPAIILQMFFLRRDYRFFIAVRENNCGDSVTYARFQKIADALDQTYAIYGAIIAIWLIIVVGDLIYALKVIRSTPSYLSQRIHVRHHRDGSEDETPVGVIMDIGITKRNSQSVDIQFDDKSDISAPKVLN